MKKYIYFLLCSALFVGCKADKEPPSDCDEVSSLLNSSQKNDLEFQKFRELVEKKPHCIPDTVKLVDEQLLRQLYYGASELGKFNVFIENSKSMWGYVSTENAFKSTILNFVTDAEEGLQIKTEPYLITDSARQIKCSNPLSCIEDYLRLQNMETGDNVKRTRLANIFQTVLKSTQKEDISMLVTDGIFASGKDGNAQEHLSAEQARNRRAFRQYLTRSNTSLWLLKLQSNFVGTYYQLNEQGGESRVPVRESDKVKRPFYLFIIGSANQISQLQRNIDLQNYLGYQNSYLLTSNHSDGLTISSKPVRFQQIGSYTVNDEKEIVQLKDSESGRNGVFSFSIAVDYSQTNFENTYVLNTANYEVSDSSYQLQVSEITNLQKANNPFLKKYSHLLKVSTVQPLKANRIGVSLLRQTKETLGWIAASDYQDGNELSPENQLTTRNFLSLITSIEGAFQQPINEKSDTYYFTIKTDIIL